VALPPPVPLSRDSDDRTPIFIPAAPQGRWVRPRARDPVQQGLFVAGLILVAILAIALV
jgi:hypothetical protein